MPILAVTAGVSGAVCARSSPHQHSWGSYRGSRDNAFRKNEKLSEASLQPKPLSYEIKIGFSKSIKFNISKAKQNRPLISIRKMT